MAEIKPGECDVCKDLAKEFASKEDAYHVAFERGIIEGRAQVVREAQAIQAQKQSRLRRFFGL